MGGIVDSIGDFAGDVVGGIGDAVGGVADFVGNALGNLDVGKLLPAAILFITTGNPSLLLAEAGSEYAAYTALETLQASGSLANAAAAAGTGSFFSPTEIGSALSTISEDPSILSAMKDAINAGDYGQIGAGYETSTEQANSIWDQIQSEWNQMEPYPGEDGSLSTGSTGNMLTKILKGVSDVVGSTGNNTGIMGLLGGLGNSLTSPAALGGIYGTLALKNQQAINDAVLGAYGSYQLGKAKKAKQYATGEGLPSLGVTVGGNPLAQALPRTAANTVSYPMGAVA
jgi:hypothetical protein